MTRLLHLSLLFTLACGDVSGTDDHDHDENEVVTTVTLTFTPVGGGDTIEATWADPEDDGSPVVDDIVLSDADDYTLTVRFLNELEDPAEDITEEVEDEADEHQVFFTGSAIGSVVTYTYDDVDGDGNPVGLEGTVTTDATGTGAFIVTLRHLPPEDGAAVKTATLADDVAAGGLSSIPGDNDANVEFSLEVE